MECKKEAYLATLELMNDKVDHTLKTSMELDLIQELLDLLPEEYQPAIRKEDFSLIPSELSLKKCPLEISSSPVETEEILKIVATNDRIFLEDNLWKNQMVQPCKKLRRSDD